MTRAHAAPFYCPYCGEEDLVPEAPASAGDAGSGHGHWSCRSCRRGFRLSLTAIAAHASTAAASTALSPEDT